MTLVPAAGEPGGVAPGHDLPGGGALPPVPDAGQVPGARLPLRPHQVLHAAHPPGESLVSYPVDAELCVRRPS